MNNSGETTPMPIKGRGGTAQRLPLIKRGRRQGKSIRQIARDLGVDEKTIRRDLETPSLPAEQQAEIEKGAAVEPFLRRARKQKAAEKASKDKEKLEKQRQARLREEAATGRHSKSLARLSLSWLRGKPLIEPDVDLILDTADRRSWYAGDQMGAPRQDADEVFQAFLIADQTSRNG